MKRIISSKGPGKRSTTANLLDGRAVPKGAARYSLIANIEALLARFDSLSAKLQSLEADLQSQSSDPQ